MHATRIAAALLWLSAARGGTDDGAGHGERHDHAARHVGDARARVRHARPRHVTPAVDWLCGAGPAARRLQRLLGRAGRRARRRSDQARRAGGVLRALSAGKRRGGPDSDRVARVPARSRRPHPALALERDGRRQPRLAGHVHVGRGRAGRDQQRRHCHRAARPRQRRRPAHRPGPRRPRPPGPIERAVLAQPARGRARHRHHCRRRRARSRRRR